MAQLISAGAFATEGEHRAAEVLTHLPDTWVVICNKILPRGDRSHEIDFIVIGTRWIFLLDEKSWKGKIHGNDQIWVREDGFSLSSPLAKVDFVAKILAGHIGWKITPLKEGKHFVRGGVLLSAAQHLPQIHDSRANKAVFLLHTVCEHLRELDSQAGSPLIGQLRPQIQKALVDLSYRPRIPKRIDSVIIDDVVTIRPGVRLFNGKMDGSPDKRAQLMVYDLTRDPLHAETLRDFYMRECRVLQKLGATGLAPTANFPYTWSEDFLVFPMLPPRGKPLSVYPLPETREDFVQELQLAATCFQVLAEIHSHGVLHRAIGPGTIFVQSPGKIVFANFYAARVGESSIAPALDALAIEDPYAHLHLAISYGYATPETDTFSLGLVLLERISGVSLSSIRVNVESEVIFPQQPRWTALLSTELADELVALFTQILLPANEIPSLTAGETATRLHEMARRLRREIQGDNVEGRILDKRYMVHRLLGRGSMAWTYLASDMEYESLGLFAIKQYINPADVLTQAEAECIAMKNLYSPHFPQISSINPPHCDAHVIMEYIPGPTLQQVEAEFPWPLERWWPFAQELLHAVGVLEQKQLLHCDIKPANIILHEADQRPVLIDFGFAIRQGTAGQLAGTPLFLPPETLATVAGLSTFPPSGDRYALGMILFKALFGSLPFTRLGGERHLSSPEQFADKKLQRIAEVLLTTVSNDPAQRPGSVEQLRQELQTAVLASDAPVHPEPLKAGSNPWVNEIRSLYRNSATGNQNNRGLESDFGRATYVPTALDDRLWPAILAKKPKALFLCGNPGDGKTAFLEKVHQEFQKRQATAHKDDASGWEWEWQGHLYRSCYDASESCGPLNADQQLTDKLRGLEGPDHPDAQITVLIAINDGRLADYFSRQQARFPWLAQQLEQAHGREDREQLAVWVVDLKQRAFVALPDAQEESVFRRVLHRLVAEENWTMCTGCLAHTTCPLRTNAHALRNPRVISRLEYLFLLSHLRRLRHMTMRDLRSALAYIITGNQSCEQIHEALQATDAGASLVNISYWQAAFAPHEQSDEVLADLMPLDPARFPHPHLDRFLHFHQTPRDEEQRRLLFANKKDLSPQRFQDATTWMAACKRRAYFDTVESGTDAGSPLPPHVEWLQLLPYQYATDFMRLLMGHLSEEHLERLRKTIALGILRSDGVIEDVPAGELSVKVSASHEQQLVILKQLPLKDFTLTVAYPEGTDMLERLPEIVVFQHHSGTPRLEITIDLFELLLRMADGLQPTAPEFLPLLEDLRLFKDALLLSETRDLVLIESQRRTHLVTQHHGKVVRTRLS